MHNLVFITLSLLLLSGHCTYAVHVDDYLSETDNARLQSVFSEGLTTADLQGIYFATKYNTAVAKVNKAELCKQLYDLHTNSALSSFEKDYYLIGSHKQLSCSNKINEAVLSGVYAALKADISSVRELYYRVASHKLLGVQIVEASKTKLSKTLEDLLRKDDSLASLGYAFSVATELGPNAAFVTNRVEDVFQQADEVDGKLLQFEGGLSITALLFNGAFKLNTAFKKPLPINAEQAVKFANYFLSRRSVQTPKGAHLVLESLKTLTEANAIEPVCVKIIGNGQIAVEAPVLSIAYVNLFGKPLKAATDKLAGKLIKLEGNAVLAEKLQLVAKSSDKTVFAADLKSYKLTRGVYQLHLTTKGAEKLQFKILGRVVVKSLELGVAESDTGSSGYEKHELTYPQKLAQLLSADHTQKLIMKTVLTDKDTNAAISVHQAFVHLYNSAQDLEVVFIAEMDGSKAYKFDLDLGAHAAEFKHTSGLYEMSLIVGDQMLSNSFKWHLANIQLKFPVDETQVSKKQAYRLPLPEIEHQFRVPDKRPSRIVSDIFTGLCVTPLVLFIFSWGKLGVNVSNFSFAPSTIGFHLGLGGILTLFGVFWWKLNMFQTLRLLIPIALFTFLCGNRLLRRLHAKRVAKA